MKSLVRVAAAGALALVPAFAFAAGSWNGFYAGGQVGVNSTSADNGISSESATDLGAFGGYNFQFSDHFVLGGNAFYEWNQQKSHQFGGLGSADVGTSVYGVDALAGFPLGQSGAWMPFLKLGYGWADFTGNGSTGVGNQSAARYGAGVAWRLTPLLGLNFQYMYQKFGSDVSNWKNQNFTVGVSVHFQ